MREKFLAQLKSIPVLVTIVYLSIAHIGLPFFNRGNDFFIFSSWSLFSHGPRKQIHDLSWDKGETFVFRDHFEHLKKSKIDFRRLFKEVRAEDLPTLRRDYLDFLKGRGSCADLELLTLKGSYHQHVFYKQKLEVIGRKNICNED